jgi:uncharacterized protein (TIGR02001 family)
MLTAPSRTFLAPWQACLLMASLAGSDVGAQTRSLSAEVALSSDLTDRGILIGPRSPITQAQLTLYDASGWSGSVAVGAQVGAPNPSQVLLRGSYEWQVNNDWRMQAGALYYSYPSDEQLQLFDHTEVALSAGFRDVVAMSVATHNFTTANDQPRARWTAEMAFRWPLTETSALSWGLGQAWLDQQGKYRYWHIGSTWHVQPWRVDVAYVATDKDAERLFGEIALPHWIFSVARSF